MMTSEFISSHTVLLEYCISVHTETTMVWTELNNLLNLLQQLCNLDCVKAWWLSVVDFSLGCLIYIFTAHVDIFHLTYKARASKITEFMHVCTYAGNACKRRRPSRQYVHTNIQYMHSCMYKKISIMPNVDCRLNLVAELLLLLWFITCLLYYNRVEYIDMNVCIYIHTKVSHAMYIHTLHYGHM